MINNISNVLSDLVRHSGEAQEIIKLLEKARDEEENKEISEFIAYSSVNDLKTTASDWVTISTVYPAHLHHGTFTWEFK